MHTTATRRAVIASVGAAALAGCLGDGGGSDTTTNSESPGTTDDETATTAEPTPDGPAPPTVEDQLPLPMEPSALQEAAVSGGPPKDGIPSIEDPRFVDADGDLDWLDPGDPVFGLEYDGTVKAYPQSILVFHEICNDVVGDTAVSVTYCPLTGTAMGFERGETTFGVSGRLVNNNLIMYDRGTETWWPQVLATAVPGPWNEDPEIRSLQEFRLIWTTWERWSDAHPDTQVLSRETGFARNYDRDPYGAYNPPSGYYAPGADPMFSPLSDDERLEPKTVVIGARTATGAAAFRKETLAAEKILRGEIGGTPVIATYDSTFDTGYVFGNPEERQFTYQDGEIADETGEQYAPDSLPMDRILAFDAMWFAWSGFYPGTTLYA